MSRGPLGDRRIAVLGAGPIGLEAALAAAELGADVRVYERALEVAANVEAWGHVRLFSPFGMNHTPVGRRWVEASGARLPDDGAYLTGREHRACYLLPLAGSAPLAGRIETDTLVLAVTRAGLLKHESIGQARRQEVPFRILVERGGAEREEAADVVLDCTGSYGNPNWLGVGGVPAMGVRSVTESSMGCRILWGATGRGTWAAGCCSWATATRRAPRPWRWLGSPVRSRAPPQSGRRGAAARRRSGGSRTIRCPSGTRWRGRPTRWLPTRIRGSAGGRRRP